MSAGTVKHPAAPLVRVLEPAGIGPAASRLVLDALASRHSPVIGVATGSSPSPLYRALAASGADFGHASWFALDEYVGLPPGHPESYAEVLRREIIEPLGLDPRAVHLPDPHSGDLPAACAAYEERIAAAGGIDLQILGIGRNGHLAFNEPGGALDSRTRVEALSEDTREANRRFFDSLEDVPTHCLTQGLGTILDAGQLLLIAQGEDKAEALRAALKGPVSRDCPASVLQLHGRVTVLADAAAAALL
ncbi:glucosamine-6-phosphate deaminase [Arthrobacter caoxuetaonis]|uniref:Glucosamine-6-phosphate deaminase n=1 Tax=Arthrobacter caoxuetaonis TaxID=2886935 RepID=A0A9X1ME87_9MICC|nr:glucosamine-6-phosphate deaminase [Arthrobacter caoxuetaonis]MCC3298419.1 glucosamine-6-phosphate deaminase [Arthrobacter caoxuetaonis]USQ57565.1 glucosamine-6-phosphate deaminase [Arthrobacter caoxuetaonis]